MCAVGTKSLIINYIYIARKAEPHKVVGNGIVQYTIVLLSINNAEDTHTHTNTRRVNEYLFFRKPRFNMNVERKTKYR